ncbi:hypothetical protein PM082_002358 [Marasmius tenuissimus]|nr:hypothetical protein PM082_002358 [Marasmius tenuissimus]
MISIGASNHNLIHAYYVGMDMDNAVSIAIAVFNGVLSGLTGPGSYTNNCTCRVWEVCGKHSSANSVNAVRRTHIPEPDGYQWTTSDSGSSLSALRRLPRESHTKTVKNEGRSLGGISDKQDSGLHKS